MTRLVNTVICGNALGVLQTLPSESVNCCVTSPPYWGLRDYGNDAQLGLERTPEEYVSKMVEIFREVKRVLRKDGTLWLNLGDSYNGSGGSGSETYAREKHTEFGKPFDIGRYQAPKKVNTLKPKDLVGIPWRVAFALQSDGWYLRSDIIWSKPNPMPESVTDRPTKAHEYIFLLTKSQKYYYDAEAIAEDSVTYEGRPSGVVRDREYGYDSKQDKIRVSLGQKSFSKGQAKGAGIEPSGNGKAQFYEVPTKRNKRSVWEVTTQPYAEAHFATYPQRLIEPCIKAGCPEYGLVLDPFFGSGTTGLVARKLNRNYIGIELNPKYVKLAEDRIAKEIGLFA